MADNTVTDLDALLADDSTAGDSQSQKQNNDNQSQQPSEEVQEFNKLSGATQDRIRKLVTRAKSAEQETERLKALALSGNKLPPPPPQNNPDVQQAVSQLDKVGVATKDYVTQQMQQLIAQMDYESKIKRLSEQESGDSDRPKFDRYEYEDFVRTNPQYRYYDPADVFAIMYRQELTDWEFNHRQTSNQTSSLKNSRTLGNTGNEIWTPEYINEMIGKNGVDWYEKNKSKIDKVMDSQS